MRVERVAQRRLQRAIELDDVHVRAAGGEVLAQHAQTAADLEHDVRSVELGGALDHAEDVRVDEEVLAEVALRAHPELLEPPQARLGWKVAHHRNRVAAFAVTCSSSSA